MISKQSTNHCIVLFYLDGLAELYEYPVGLKSCYILVWFTSVA